MPARARTRRSRDGGSGAEVVPEVVVAGRAPIAGRLTQVEIGVDGTGRIVRIARNVRGGERLDYGDLVLLPSATDLHVHFREPTQGERFEDLARGTEQAALGGVGLVGDMPNTDPPMDSADRLEEKARRSRGRLAVDVLLYGAAQPGGRIAEMSAYAGAFKLYLSPTTAVGEVPEPGEIRPVLEAVARTGLALSVHAEDPSRFRTTDPEPSSLAEWDLARPIEAEARGIDRLLPSPPALRLHIAHVTDAAQVARLREQGLSFEATPHHLLLSTLAGPDARWKVNPPLRPEAARSALWEEFAAGRVPILASDHAPHPAPEKEGPFARAPSGVPGVATMLPLMLEQARTGRIPLTTLLAAACDRPARWFGVPMGRIAVGHRADLLVVDFRRHREIRARDLAASVGWSPFEGRGAVFPQHHLRAGVPIVDEGEYVGGRSGEIVRPEYAPTIGQTNGPRRYPEPG